MKKKILTVLVTGLFMLGMVEMANAAFVNFDDLPGGGSTTSGSVMTDAYTSIGVTFIGDDPYVPYVWNNNSNDGNYLSNTITSNPVDPIGNYFDISFNELVSNVSLLLQSHGNHSNGIEFSVFNSNDVLIEDFLAEGDWVNIDFSSSDISSIRVSNTLDNWTYGIDDLSFDVSSVPLPGAIWLLGSGILVLVGVSRKKNIELK